MVMVDRNRESSAYSAAISAASPGVSSGRSARSRTVKLRADDVPVDGFDPVPPGRAGPGLAWFMLLPPG